MTEYPSGLTWTRSTRCESGHCVEVAFDGDRVLVRNSRTPDGPVLSFTHREWQTELDEIRDEGLPHGLSLLLPAGDMLWEHDGRAVKFSSDEVGAFIDGALDGEFDLPEPSHVS